MTLGEFRRATSALDSDTELFINTLGSDNTEGYTVETVLISISDETDITILCGKGNL